MRQTRFLFALAGLLMSVLTTSGGLIAGEITVKSLKVSRPAYLRPHPTESREIRDYDFHSENRKFVPAAQQAVYFYDEDPIFDEFCGAYWTDLRGEIKNAKIDCGDRDDLFTGNYNPADVVAKVYARSGKGFEIYKTTNLGGDLSIMKWTIDNDFSLVNERGRTARRSDSKFVTMGSWKIGGSSEGRTHRQAAALHEMLDWVYSSLSSFANQWAPDSDWMLDFPVGYAFTRWDEVYFNSDDASFKFPMQAAAHEMGHVIYNKLHSGRWHYENELLQYAHDHSACRPVTETSQTDPGNPKKFAQYEGYAETTHDLLWFTETGLARHFPSGCAEETGNRSRLGMDIEGNVNAFYFWTLMGSDPSERRPLTTFSERTLSLRPVSDHFRMVDRAGSESHTVRKMWDQYLNQVCHQSDLYCGTEPFEDLVREELLKAGEELF